jgi:hypothetical protein
MAENDHNPLFGISLAEKDRVLTLLTQSDGILGLIKHVDESTPPDYLANSVWLLHAARLPRQFCLVAAGRPGANQRHAGGHQARARPRHLKVSDKKRAGQVHEHPASPDQDPTARS